MVWYIAQNGKAEKISEEDLTAKIKSGEIHDDTLVVNAEIKNWVYVNQTDLWKALHTDGSLPDDSISAEKQEKPLINGILQSPAAHSQNTADGADADLKDKRVHSSKTKREITILSITAAVALMFVGVLAVILTTVIKNLNTGSPTLPSSSASSGSLAFSDTTAPSGTTAPSSTTAPSGTSASSGTSTSIGGTINEDLLSDIGRTYGEISKKYGEGTNIGGFEGELSAEFENSTYHFRAGDIHGSAYSGDGGFEVIPEDDAVCFRIDTDAKTLFNGFTDRYSISDIEQELGVSASTVFSDLTVERYLCHFEYGNCDIDITLDVNGDEVTDEFTKDSDTFIALKDSFSALYERDTEFPSSSGKVSFNENLLSDIGLTYGQINAKYGKETHCDGFGGSLFYEFEYGPGSYFFKDENERTVFVDETGNFISPDEDAVCFNIITDAKTLFNNFEGTKSISEIERELELPIEYYENDPEYSEFDTNICSFDYGNYHITINIERGIGMTVVEDAMAVISTRS